MNEQQLERFNRIRSKAFRAIEEIINETGHCKSYEGMTEVTTVFPDVFSEEKGEEVVDITFHCYLMGNGRHHKFRARTMDKALDKFEQFIDSETKGWEETT